MIVFHGNSLVASRNALNSTIENAKKKGIKDIAYLNGLTMHLEELKQALEAQSLFGTDRLVIVENLLFRKPSKEKKEIISYLKSANITNNLLLWEKNSNSNTVKKTSCFFENPTF